MYTYLTSPVSLKPILRTRIKWEQQESNLRNTYLIIPIRHISLFELHFYSIQSLSSLTFRNKMIFLDNFFFTFLYSLESTRILVLSSRTTKYLSASFDTATTSLSIAFLPSWNKNWDSRIWTCDTSAYLSQLSLLSHSVMIMHAQTIQPSYKSFLPIVIGRDMTINLIFSNNKQIPSSIFTRRLNVN